MLSVSVLKDVNAQQFAYPGIWTAATLNGVAIISQDDAVHGRELWRSDGTLAGTSLLKDIDPGDLASYPDNFTVVGSTMFFTASDGVTGDELWKTDGTADGTVLVADINPGISSSNPNELTAVGSTLFFSATDGTHGYELWKSDGTTAGTVMVDDLNPGAGDGMNLSGSRYPYVVNDNGTLFFSGTDGVNGLELWKSDGTAAGTVMVKDIYAGSQTSSPGVLTPLNGVVYFAATSGAAGNVLWKSDGTAAGTVAVSPTITGPRTIAVAGNDLYVVSSDTNGNLSEVGYDTTTGSSKVLLASSAMSGYAEVNGSLYFTAKGVFDRADGLTVTTLRSGLTSVGNYVRNVNGTAYFAADGGSGTGQELWKSNGTAATTTLLKDVVPGTYASQPTAFIPVGTSGSFIFEAADPTSGGALYVSNGTTAGTGLLDDVFTGTDASNPQNYTAFNGYTYFSASDGLHGIELWRTDGTDAGTTLFDDINTVAGTTPASSAPAYLTVFNGKLYFSANDGTHGAELWSTDGTVAGTAMVKDISPGNAGSVPAADGSKFIVSGGYLYFVANDGTNGRQLWRTDGTAAATIRVSSLTSGAPTYLTDLNGTLYFASSSSSGALWKSDGTLAGTVALRTDLTSVQNVVNLGGTLYFFSKSTTKSGFAAGLWRSDGTATGTTEVWTPPSSTDTGLASLTVVGSRLFFVNTDSAGAELWTSDGTTAGTARVADINPAGSSSPTVLTNANGVVYFIASDGTHPYELWRSDGTAAGTYRLDDSAYNTIPNTRVVNVASVNGYVYFVTRYSSTASNGFYVYETWRTDGTSAGTVKLIRGGLSYSFTQLGNAVVFTSQDGLHYVEPFIADAPVFASLDASGTLTVTGTANNDVIGLASDGTTLTVTLNGLTSTFPAVGVSSIVVNGGTGQETLNVSSNLPAPLTFASSASAFTLNVNADVTLANDAAVTAGVNVHVAAGATLTLSGNQHFTSVALDGNLMAPAIGATTLTLTGALTVSPTGSLDLGRAQLLLNSQTTSLAALRALLSTASDNGVWDGIGGVTSSVVAGNPAQKTLEYFTGATAANASLNPLLGDPNALFVSLALVGDFNLDGKVDRFDIRQFNARNAFNDGLVTHDSADGDLTFDGKVDRFDIRAFNAGNNFNGTLVAVAMPMPVTPPLTAPEKKDDVPDVLR